MSSERSLRTAGIAVSIAFLALAVLSSTDVLPPWIFRAVLFLLGALLWGWLLIRTYRTLQPRQRGWMLFWQYALPLFGSLPLSELIAADPLGADRCTDHRRTGHRPLHRHHLLFHS